MTNLLQINPAKPLFTAFDAPESEQDDIELLHSISVELIGEQDRLELYGKIVDAAIKITQSQCGTMQLLCASDGSGHGGNLQLLCSRGLQPEAEKFWQLVTPAAHSSCTAALKSGRRAVIPDYETWDEILGTEDLLAFRRSGIRSAQTTPLRSRSGNLLGMISTHWSKPHQPSERDLRLLDILARQAADLLERTIAEEALRTREQELDRTCAALSEAEERLALVNEELSHRLKNTLGLVSAIATQSLRGIRDLEPVKDFELRLQALGHAHDVLRNQLWEAAPIQTISANVIADAGQAGRVSIAGPDMALGARSALTFSLVLHELVTNALKYGALSTDAGSSALLWALHDEDGEQVLTVSWEENGGPPVVEPSRKGFGTRLISMGLTGTGGATVRYEPSGLKAIFRCSLRDAQTN